MSYWDSTLVKKKLRFHAFFVVTAILVLTILLADTRPVSALPVPGSAVRAIPAFARKYGMPCSSCHQAWPMLSPFGQAFKDNGYQLGNERDAPDRPGATIAGSTYTGPRAAAADIKRATHQIDRAACKPTAGHSATPWRCWATAAKASNTPTARL